MPQIMRIYIEKLSMIQMYLHSSVFVLIKNLKQVYTYF